MRALSTLPAFGALLRAVEEKRQALASGLWGASAGLLVAAVVKETKRPALVVAADQAEADRLEDDMSTFLGSRVYPFPAYDVPPDETESPEFAVLSARLAALRRLGGKGGSLAVTAPVAAILQPVPSPEALGAGGLVLKTGEEAGFSRLVDWLFEKGYERVPAVGSRGEFAVRGGIVDVFPFFTPSVAVTEEERPQESPARVEFDGDAVASLRTFDLASQRSMEEVGEYELPGIGRRGAFAPGGAELSANVMSHLPDGTLVVIVEPGDVERVAGAFEAGLSGGGPRWRALKDELAEKLAVLEIHSLGGPADASFEVRSLERLSGRHEQLARRLEELARTGRLTVFCRTSAEEERLLRILKGAEFSFPASFETRKGRISAGFEFRDLRWAAVADHELLGKTGEHRRVRTVPRGEPISSFLELSAGDYVVHATHGIGRYLGMTTLGDPGREEDYLTLLFAQNAKVYVPASHVYLIEKYMGAGEERPTLSRIGSKLWAGKKRRAEAAARDIAAELLRTQAERMGAAGIAYPPDSDWQLEFEAAFPFEETPDQLTASEAIKRDMERPVPMDRLLSGDVGFGKTEVAMRAAFKAVTAGRQVAVLAPTTLLVEQHHKTFTERLESYPVEIAPLSRLRTRSERAEVLRGLRDGRVDIVVGTHGLLGRDVVFRDLGLIIIDEEHRFGVKHKERLKELRLSVDVLTLSATPIPRTLHMSVVGIRDISSLTIPPEDRLSIRTKLCRPSPDLIRPAILRELARGGQVYFVNDKVLDIDALAAQLQSIVPEARFAVVHGQLPERLIEGRMAAFLERDCEVLVSTSIVESGLDIPTANTIFVNNAHRFGLAELHQLRGRVGRYKHQAYAYLLIPRDRPITADAKKRLKAVEEFSELGAGFRLAMKDLEIRGAGNLLGTEQSGHIAQIGYELYCRLLEKAVRSLRGQHVREPVDVTLELRWGAYLPDSYVREESLKLELYTKLSACRSDGEPELLAEEMRDRFGPLPEPAKKLLAEARLRIRARAAGIPYVGREARRLVFKLREMRFKELERAVAGLPGDFQALGPEGFAVGLRPEALTEEGVEAAISGFLDRLR